MTLAETVLPFLSVTALTSTIGFFLCGLQICNRIKQRGTTDGTSPAPFLMAFLSCTFFIQYGVLKQDDIITYCNASGAFLQAVYLVYFYKMTRNRRFLNKILLVEFILISGLVYYCRHASVVNSLDNVGNICIFLNIASVGAPLLDIGKVISTKSSESLPFPLCVACCVVCIQWFLYGLLVEDNVIIIPNFIATVISILQLSLFVIYPGQTKVFPDGEKFDKLAFEHEV